MNKKMIASLLGGGVTVTLATVGGIKAKENIDYKKKLNHYKKVAENFKATNATTSLKNHYLPEWDNNALWKRHYDTLTQKDHPNAQAFRDHCYKEAEKAQKNNSNDCKRSSGWCSVCPRDEQWTRS